MRIRVAGKTSREKFKENVVDRFFDMVEDEQGDELGFTLALAGERHTGTGFRLSNAIDALEDLIEEDSGELKHNEREIREALQILESLEHDYVERMRE